LIFFNAPMLGASGAIMGMVGMYLVFFPENDISCLFIFLFFFYFRLWWFTVRSFWMILLWFAFDIFGAVSGGGGVAYFAHIGGFGTGFVLGIVLLKTKMITMEKHETSLFKLLGLEKNDTAEATQTRGDLAYWQQGWSEEGVKQVIHKPEAPPEDLLTVQQPAQDSEAPLIEVAPLSPRFVRFRCQCGSESRYRANTPA